MLDDLKKISRQYLDGTIDGENYYNLILAYFDKYVEDDPKADENLTAFADHIVNAG